jgi:hypothetical protein
MHQAWSVGCKFERESRRAQRRIRHATTGGEKVQHYSLVGSVLMHVGR